MKALACPLLCAIAGSAAARPMQPFDPGTGPASVSSEETERTVRRVYAGTVTAIADDPGQPGAHLVTIRGSLQRFAGDDPDGQHPLPVDKTTPGRDRIKVALPSKLALPFGVGDSIRATMWSVRVGQIAWDYTASLTGADGEPLIVEGSGAPGWTFANGGAVPHRSPAATVEHYVVIHGPGSITGKVASSWAHGMANGADYAIYGVSRQADTSRHGSRPHDWANVFSVILIKVKAPTCSSEDRDCPAP